MTQTRYKELEWRGEAKRGDNGLAVRRAQEWLILRGERVVLDGEFGARTAAAVIRFQNARRLSATGVVDATTFESLSSPMRDAVAPITPAAGATVGGLAVLHAKAHLAASARELDDPNSGPWVRLYMGGNEGEPWPWCAGFVGFVVRQALEDLRLRVAPFRLSYGCTQMARAAQLERRFLSGREAVGKLRAGCVFVVPKQGGGWSHTGIVTDAHGDEFECIEGNTNESGSREGTCVKARSRRVTSHDFLVLDTTP